MHMRSWCSRRTANNCDDDDDDDDKTTYLVLSSTALMKPVVHTLRTLDCDSKTSDSDWQTLDCGGKQDATAALTQRAQQSH